MIGGLMALAAGRTTASDAVAKADDTLSIHLDEAGIATVTGRQGLWAGCRVQREGRIGSAWAHGADPEWLLEAAVASAAVSDEGRLHLPAPAPLARVQCADREAAAATAGTVVALARQFHQRLQARGRQVTCWAERSVGWVEVGNTRGVLARYDQTLAGIGATVTQDGDAPCSVWWSGVSLPGLGELEMLAAEVEALLAAPVDHSTSAPPPGPVLLLPRAVAGLLQPLHAVIAGRGHRELPALDPSLTIRDDPHVPWRPGSRPVDDEGVPTMPRLMVNQGGIRGGLADLATAHQLGVPATGSAVRRPGTVPRCAWSNLVMEPGSESAGGLADAARDGVLIRDLCWDGAAGDGRGDCRFRVEAAYRLRGTEVASRLAPFEWTGNLFEWLSRVPALGRDREWVGAAQVPAMVIITG